jgi:hypothetical protein
LLELVTGNQNPLDVSLSEEMSIPRVQITSYQFQ